MEICYGTIGRRAKRRHGAKFLIIPGLLLSILTAGVFLYLGIVDASTANTKAITPAAVKSASKAAVKSISVQNHVLLSTSGKAAKIPNEEVQSTQAIPVTPEPGKTAYLTFDDGPSRSITPQVLGILDKYGIKANFFLIGQECKRFPDLVIKENAAGHSICNHTYSHKYKMIYSSVKSFVADVTKCNNEIKSILGNDYKGKYVRFPGGGFGKKYEPFKNAVSDKGYDTVSWDIDTGDSRGMGIPSQELIRNVKTQITKIRHGKSIVVLMHDMAGKQTTVDALPTIIKFLQSEGYSFATFN